ncbi:MAG: sigma-70 family RNA polymerase sigma factor [Dehalococcoidia bacterium]|nr:sigma-70 family RNA polymerase sigma factor [Dehalococcoidia bacterium]
MPARWPAFQTHSPILHRHRSTPLSNPHARGAATGPRIEADAFSALYEAHAPRVYRYLLSRTSRPAEAEELTSRTFLNALTHLEGYRGGRGGGADPFGSWLMSIAHNLLANWYRDRGRRPPTAPLDDALTIPTEGPDPQSTLEMSEQVRRVREAVRALAPDRQELLAFKYVEGLTNAQIGERMGRSEGAVKALHHRTLRQLQETLREP